MLVARSFGLNQTTCFEVVLACPWNHFFDLDGTHTVNPYQAWISDWERSFGVGDETQEEKRRGRGLAVR